MVGKVSETTPEKYADQWEKAESSVGAYEKKRNDMNSPRNHLRALCARKEQLRCLACKREKNEILVMWERGRRSKERQNWQKKNPERAIGDGKGLS